MISGIRSVIVFSFLSAIIGQYCAAQSIVVQPPANTFKISSDLAGKHPRLYFTHADIASIKQKAQGPNKWFYDKAKQSFGSYKGKSPDPPGTWKDYLFGFWGQFSMCMFYLVEGDTGYANTAVNWALYYARRSDWLIDDLVPMDITSGMALTYDILYDYLTPAQRTEIRGGLKRSLDTMMIHFFQGEYWTNDFQNNHMHNRIHGIAHAAFALYGDDVSMNVQSSADLAVGCFQDVVRWLPDDGSTHEGPGYWDYGYHWVARTAELIKHVTGTDPVANSPHFAVDHLYRLYLTTPGWNNMFGIGDAGEGAPANAEAWLPAIMRTRDAASDSVFRRLMKEQAGGFYQHTMWGVLWYDANLQPKPYSSLPLYRFWPDLEMFSIRSSWDDTATAFVFKCGPPGGHHMQQLRGTKYANVAHDHPDQNHFMLFANGRLLAQDDGYPTDKKLTRSHNTIVIDTVGQINDGQGWYQPFDYNLTGYLDDIMLSGSSASSAGNATKLYTNASKFIRHIAFIEGGYVVSIDDLAGSGSGTHTFDWRLHKAGTWSTGQPGQFFVADSSNMRLEIKFLEPAAASIQSAFLPVETTAQPCLSVKTTAASTRITAVIVPQHNSQPALISRMLAATGGTAVEIQGAAFVDVFAVRSDSNGFSAGDISSNATQVIVRKQNASPTVAMITRGKLLTIGGKTILQSMFPANCAWRSYTGGATVEAEPAYKSAGGADTIRIGGLTASKQYAVNINGIAAGSATSDANGVVSAFVNLTSRQVIGISDGSGTTRTVQNENTGLFFLHPVSGGMEFFLNTSDGRKASITIHDLSGKIIWQWRDASGINGTRRIVWPGIGVDNQQIPAGTYAIRARIGDSCFSRLLALMKPR